MKGYSKTHFETNSKIIVGPSGNRELCAVADESDDTTNKVDLNSKQVGGISKCCKPAMLDNDSFVLYIGKRGEVLWE